MTVFLSAAHPKHHQAQAQALWQEVDRSQLIRQAQKENLRLQLQAALGTTPVLKAKVKPSSLLYQANINCGFPGQVAASKMI